MRKLNPSGICADFNSETTGYIDFLNEVAGRLDDQGAHDRRLAALCELVFHRGYVAFEYFLSALFIGCINGDARAFLQSEAGRIDASIAQKFSPAHASRTHVQVVKHLPAAEIDRLVNPDGKNVTFSSAGLMISRAKDWLAPHYAAKFAALSPTQIAIVDTAKLLRNCIAHQSQRSYDEMNVALRKLPNVSPLWNFRRGGNRVHSVGAYLKTSIAGKSRTELFLEQFQSVAATLK